MRWKIAMVCSFFSVGLSAQNLVPNPSFEELTRCPNSFSTDKNDFIVPGWESPTKGTPDHFHGCSWGEADVPFNWAGSANAHSGKGYAGMYVWNKRDDDKSYREYIQCELAEPLVEGDVYKLEFYYKLASHAVYVINRIGLVVTTTRLSYSHDQVIDIIPTLSVELDSAVTTTTGSWEHAMVEYKAAGGERYLTIGNFFNNKETKSTRLPYRIGKNSMLTTSAYYFIDDVSVKAIDSLKNRTVPAALKYRKDTVELNRDYVLKNIQFEFDSYVLLRSSFVELDKVVDYLKDSPEINVRLSGHTDFIGSDDYNITLSRNRARSVADYFVSKGIQSQRIISYGFGKTRPIVLDKTDEARKINRRVEIRFVME
jgi:outer membrane protein OmpA-like peptidoglycan-associated protein